MTNKKQLAIQEVHGAVAYTQCGLVLCRVCKCTAIQGCNPPCAWDPSDSRGDICTTCAYAVGELMDWMRAAHIPTVAALLREFKVQDKLRE